MNIILQGPSGSIIFSEYVCLETVKQSEGGQKEKDIVILKHICGI